MNSLTARLRAIGVSAIAFALAGLGYALLRAGIAQWPALSDRLDSPAPADALSTFAASALPGLLSGLYLVVSAGVLLLNSGYLDRMLEILGDVLLMTISAMAGAMIGLWLALRLFGATQDLSVETFWPLGPPALVVLLVLILAPQRVRGNIALRLFAVLALLIGAPLLMAVSF